MALATQDLPFGEPGLAAAARDLDHRGTSVKIVLDALLALLLLLGSMPLVLLSLVLVRLTSRGPVIYAQRRLGRGGRVFTIYKIRTMYQNSEPHGARWSLPGDPRVTPIGRLLRWSHIDELPQLFNVLRGDMSLIGPRPERPEIVPELQRAYPDYSRRMLVRPGLTGLAQVLQPPDVHLGMVGSKLFYDLHYIDQWSLRLDLRILLATVLHLVNAPPEFIAWFFGFPLWEEGPEQEASVPVEERALLPHMPPPYSEGCSAG